MESNQEAEQNEEEHTRTILQSMLQQNQQNPILLPLTQSIIEAILGGEIQLRDIAQPLQFESDTEEEEIEESLRRHRYFDDDDESPPPNKRSQLFF